MQGITIFKQDYAPRASRVVKGFDGVTHSTHSHHAIGLVSGNVGKMTAIVANEQSDTWHVVNLKHTNGFDAVAVLGAFDGEEATDIAMRCHGNFYDAMCGDVCESNTGGLQRFLNHHFYMSTNRPVYAEELAKLQDIPSTQSILWDGVQLKSHNGSSKHLLLDMMRCDDDKALLEKMDFVEEESKLDGEIAEYDALVVEAYKLEGTVSKLALAMDKATSISTLKVAKQTLSKPKTMRGFGVIQQLVSFELSDGQAVSIIFNVSDSEANASAKMTKDDLLVSWKYKLNSRDITAAVQPNATQNVSLNMIASRIMGLADANSEKFVVAQKKKDAMQTELANTNQQVKDLQGQEQALLQEIADLQKQLDEKAKNKALQEAESRAEVEGMAKTVQSAPQDRPADYRTNLANARAVAKSLGIETKGKKLERLVKEIDIFDEKEVKKELLSEFKALASRLVLPKGYVFDLSDAEKSIDDITRWVSPIIKQKGAFDFNKIRIELRAVTSINEYEGGVYISDYVFFYTDDKNAKKEMGSLNYPNDGNINASDPKTPKATVAKMEEFLIKEVFPKIEYLKVLNSTDVDVSKLSEIGIAEITDIGNENLYFEKDGKYYVSKVGNPQLYALGEWDFAKYPDGKQVAPVAQPNNTLQKDISKSELFKDANVWAIDDFGKENGMVIYSRDEQDGFSIGIVDKLKQVNMQYTDIDTDQQTNESFSTENITNEQVIDRIKAFIAKHEQKSVELLPVQTVSEPPMTDFALVTFNAWKKGGKHRIYLKVSENDNAFNEMDYGANDLGYLEVVGKNGSKKINNLSTVSRYSELEDKIIGSAFVDALQEYLSLKDIDIAEFNVATLKVKIKSDADVLAAKQAEWKEEANAEAQAKQAKQDKTDLQQAIIKENIDKFGRDVVVNDLSDAVLGNKAKVEAILAGALMKDEDFDSFLSYQASAKRVSEPPMTNPDRDYLQSIIDGDVDPLTVDIDTVIALAEKYDGDAEITPLLDQALEVINQAEQEAAKGI